MTDPLPVTPLYYQTPPPSSSDVSNLKTLSILHYVWGGLSMLFSSIFIIHIVLGILMVGGNLPGAPAKSGFGPNAPAGPPSEMGYLFIGMGSCAVVFGWSIGICAIISGRKIVARRSRVFSMVVAGINCISFPLGTVLGVFTIIVLSKDSVKALYNDAAI